MHLLAHRSISVNLRVLETATTSGQYDDLERALPRRYRMSSIRFYGWCVGLSATIVRRTRPKHGSSLGASITDHLKCSRFSVRLWVVCTWIITRNQTNETCTFHHHSEMDAMLLASKMVFRQTEDTPLESVRSIAKRRSAIVVNSCAMNLKL